MADICRYRDHLSSCKSRNIFFWLIWGERSQSLEKSSSGKVCAIAALYDPKYFFLMKEEPPFAFSCLEETRYQFSGINGSNPDSLANSTKNLRRFCGLFQCPRSLFRLFGIFVGSPNLFLFGTFSVKLSQTFCQVMSGLSRDRDGFLGVLLPSIIPRYLKETMSPILGCHFFTNSMVPGAAVNVTLFGDMHSQMLGAEQPTIFASASLAFLCLRKVEERPGE